MDNVKTIRNRKQVPYETQVQVFFREGWLCHWCNKPTIFQPAIKYLEKFINDGGYPYKIAYYNQNNRRDMAPLLDCLTSILDHVEPHSKGGNCEVSNLVLSCNKCNMRKSDIDPNIFSNANPKKKSFAKYGDPTHWDGMVSLFILLSDRYKKDLTPSERSWIKALNNYYQKNESQWLKMSNARVASDCS